MVGALLWLALLQACGGHGLSQPQSEQDQHDEWLKFDLEQLVGDSDGKGDSLAKSNVTAPVPVIHIHRPLPDPSGMEEPPPSLECYAALVGEWNNATDEAAKFEAIAAAAGADFTAKTILKEEAWRQASKSETQADETQDKLTLERKTFAAHELSTKSTLELAERQALLYRKLEQSVSKDVTRAKEAFTRYLKYKQAYIEAHANAKHSSSAEIHQYEKLKEQYLSSYSQLGVQIKAARENAKHASHRYTKYSGRYQRMVDQAKHMSHQIEVSSSRYQALVQKHHANKAAYTKLIGQVSKAAAKQKEAADQSKQQHAIGEEVHKVGLAAKRRYWELFGIVKRYTKELNTATEMTEMQSVRFARLDRRLHRLEAELVQQTLQKKAIAGKLADAEEAGRVYLKNYQEADCDGDLATSDAEVQSKEKVTAAEANKQTANPLDEATKPSDTAVMYRDLYSSFKKRYSQALTRKAKVKLGERSYNKCQYFTKLATMYSKLQDVHHKLQDTDGPAGSVEVHRIEQQQRGRLNAARAKHFAGLMRRSCKMPSSQSRQLLSTLALLDSQREEKDSLQQASTCERFKEVATANMEASETGRLSLATHAKYMGMLKKGIEEAKGKVESTAAMRDGAIGRARRFKKIVDSASTELKNPC
eukprot:TRINITY_DN351_c0_g1_i4.p1 TRINITY_DN351_c0_g1~~TRINITY_DN351_c0_g1_i4.p1  ORF type:complete len:647 (-),score=214.04 TRINITY_DN351_c0_g1_i4:327-2267(-)